MARLGEMFKTADVKKPEPHPRRETKWIHYTKLTDNRKQYRSSAEDKDIETLAMLIEADKGVVQNLLVRKIDTDEYEIIAGHHRKKACQYLVEEKGLKEYEFLPCTVEKMDDVRAEFQLYSSNGFIPKNDYERMHELERMKYLLQTYPEEFPHLQAGRMVERLAQQMNMKKTTVGEFLSISKNLGEKGKEAFRDGELNKSAALEMSTLPEKEQNQLIDQGVTVQRDIQAYKAKREPSDKDIRKFYEYIRGEDKDRSKLKDVLRERYGKSHAGHASDSLSYECSPRGVRIGSAEEITWARLVQRINLLVPQPDRAVMENTAPEAHKESTGKKQRENVPESGTKELPEPPGEPEPPEEPETYTPAFFLQEQKEKLEQMIKCREKGDVVPEIMMERQKVIVQALTKLVMTDIDIWLGHQT